MVEVETLGTLETNSIAESDTLRRVSGDTLALLVQNIVTVTFKTFTYIRVAFAVGVISVDNIWRQSGQSLIASLVGFIAVLALSLITSLVLGPVVVWTFSVNRISIPPCVSITVITRDTLTVRLTPCLTIVIYPNTLVFLSVVV